LDLFVDGQDSKQPSSQTTWLKVIPHIYYYFNQNYSKEQ